LGKRRLSIDTDEGSHGAFRRTLWRDLFHHGLLSAAWIDQLCHDETAEVLENTARIYHERGRWNLNLLLLMPDHLHASRFRIIRAIQ
jgi:hypothetical protein